MAQVVPCLRRVGNNVKKYRLIQLNNKEEVTIGRSPDVSVCIISNMISRHHATLKKQEDGSWTITDNQSLNGIYVNAVKLEPRIPRLLNDEDLVQLGVCVPPETVSEFMFMFHKALKVKRRPHDIVVDSTDGNNYNNVSNNKIPGKKKRRVDFDEAELSAFKVNRTKGPDDMCPVTSSQLDIEPSTTRSNDIQHSSWSPYTKYKKKLEEQESEAHNKLKAFEKRMDEMQEMLRLKETEQKLMQEKLNEEKEKSCHQEKMLHTFKDKEKELKAELQNKQAEMKQEKLELERKMREELEEQLKEKETLLLDKLSKQRTALISEKEKVEASLQKEMKRALVEKNKDMEDKLREEKKKLDLVIAKKELEQKMLESQLNETKSENEKHKEAMLRAREDVLSNFSDLMEMELQCSICNELFIQVSRSDLMEMELQCSICNELFIQATSLNCSHAFCHLCIEQWLKKKKECPICRAAVTSHMKSIVLDSYIAKMVEQLSDELKERRKNLLAERKIEQAEYDAKNAPPAAVTKKRGRRNRATPAANVAASTSTAANPNAPAERPTTRSRQPIIVESDSPMSVSDDEDSTPFFSDEDDSDSMDGEYGAYGAYYGGYGNCYICGRRGHWSRGCPNR